MKTLKSVREDFELRGEAISEWAEREGFNRRSVYAVLNGSNKGKRGKAHKIAVRLGLKPDINKERR